MVVLRKIRTATRLAKQTFQYWHTPIATSQAGLSPRVLFVSEAKGATLRYRVLNQIEELHIQGIQAAAVHPSYHGVLASARDCELLVLYRVSNTSMIQNILQAARTNGARILFDTDDLVWHERIIQDCNLDQTHTATDIAALRQQFAESARLMHNVDAFVASTPFLAELIRADFSQPVFVNMNALNQALIIQSDSVLRQPRRLREDVIIGYFSGWPRAHEQDLAVALPALQQVLEMLPYVRLRIVGHFDRMQLPEKLRDQVEIAPFVPYEQLLTSISDVDINIAPIVDNPHRRAKSAVKFLEAALVAVPTVATDLEPYQIIRHGQTGLLASDTQSWVTALLQLAQNTALRDTIGQAARVQVLVEHTTAVRSAHFAEILKESTI